MQNIITNMMSRIHIEWKISINGSTGREVSLKYILFYVESRKRF